MYHVSAQGVGELMINVHYYYYYTNTFAHIYTQYISQLKEFKNKWGVGGWGVEQLGE